MEGCDRKRGGNGTGIRRAHPSAVLSQEKFRIRPYWEPAREGIRALRAAARVFARVTNLRNPDVSSPPQTSFRVADGAVSAAYGNRFGIVAHPRAVGY